MLTPDEATAALREASRVRHLGRRLVHGQVTRLPMVWWGVTWMVAYSSAQFLPMLPAMAIATVAAAGAFALSRMGARWDPAPGRTGWERQFMRSWWVVLVAGFAMDLIAGQVPTPVYYLIPGAVWGLATLIYAVAADDWALGLLGAGIVAIAAVVRLLFLPESLFLFGLLGGGWMVATGLARLVGPVGSR